MATAAPLGPPAAAATTDVTPPALTVEEGTPGDGAVPAKTGSPETGTTRTVGSDGGVNGSTCTVAVEATAAGPTRRVEADETVDGSICRKCMVLLGITPGLLSAGWLGSERPPRKKITPARWSAGHAAVWSAKASEPLASAVPVHKELSPPWNGRAA